jgi:hypothetical protein
MTAISNAIINRDVTSAQRASQLTNAASPSSEVRRAVAFLLTG